MKKVIAVLFVVLSISLAGFGDVLRWQIIGTENVDGHPSVYSFLQPDEQFGVRLAAYDSSDNLVSYLNPVYGPPAGSEPFAAGSVDYEYNDERIGTRDDFPTGARQALYSGEYAQERRYQMQIGLYDADFNFCPTLYSDAMLVGSTYRYEPGSLYPPGSDWAVLDFYTQNPVLAPEPSSALFCIFGIGLLMLTRRVD